MEYIFPQPTTIQLSPADIAGTPYLIIKEGETTGRNCAPFLGGAYIVYPEAYQEGYEDAYPEMEVTTYEDDIEVIEDDGEDIQPQWDDDWN